MASSDAIMLDSPAQTPDPKGQFHSIQSNTDMPAGQPMVIDSQANEGSASGSWDTKKWREELQSVENKLQHPHWSPSKRYRDPMSKPLVTRPNDLTPEMDGRLREYFQGGKAGLQAM